MGKELKEIIETNGVNDKLLVFCLSVGLRTLGEDDIENREDLLKQLNLTEEKVEKLIDDLDNLSWTV